MFATKETFGSGGKVLYYPLDELPKIKPFCLTDEERIANMMQVIYTLPNIFSKEDEYRLAKMNMQNQVVTLNADALEEVILSEYINKVAKAEIISLSKDRFPKAKILQAKFNLDKGSCDFTPLK